MKFGDLLIQHRQRQGLTKTDLANQIEVTPGYYMHIETGRRPPPTFEKCQTLASILKLNPREKRDFLKSAFEERSNQDEKRFIEIIYPQKMLETADKEYIKIAPEILDALEDPAAVKALLLVHQNAKEIKQAIQGLLENLPKMDPEKRKAILALCS